MIRKSYVEFMFLCFDDNKNEMNDILISWFF